MNLQIVIENIIIVLFIIHVLRVTFLEVFIWQLKEYRLDRLLAHLRTLRGRKLVTNPLVYIKWIVLLVFLIFHNLSTVSHINYFFLTIVLLLIYLTETLIVARRGVSAFKLPKFTFKATFITLAAFILILTGFVIFPLDRLLLIQLFDRLLAFVIVLFVLITSVPTYIHKKLISFPARRKITSNLSLLIIGITGSFGKTSTKDFLASILSDKYKVLKTKASQNTEIAVVQTVNKSLKTIHQVFLVEMGAYKKGEIASICNIAKPQIGIITGIDRQHIELFGSIEKTMKAKFELIKNIKDGGTAIFNAGNKYVREMIKWAKNERPDLTIWEYCVLPSSFRHSMGILKQVQDDKMLVQHDIYSVNSGSKKDKFVYARDVKIGKSYLSFKLGYDGREVSCKTKLFGIGNVDNILASTSCALSLGLSLSQIQKSITKLVPSPQTMKVYKKKDLPVLVDDTFNTNPTGVSTALDYLSLNKGKKVLVLTPLIELGKYARSIHEELGQKAALICNLILLTNSNYYQAFIKGADKVKDGSKKVRIIDRVDLDKILKPYFNKETMFIFEGKEAMKVMDRLMING